MQTQFSNNCVICTNHVAELWQTIGSSFQDERVAKVTPERIYSLAIHPSVDRLIVGVGDKSGNVGLWSVDDKTAKKHGVEVFQVNCSFGAGIFLGWPWLGAIFVHPDH